MPVVAPRLQPQPRRLGRIWDQCASRRFGRRGSFRRLPCGFGTIERMSGSARQTPLTIAWFVAALPVRPEQAGHTFQALARPLARLACQTHRLARDEADEIVSEVYLRATAGDCAALRRARPTAALGAWIRGAVRRIALERVRRAARERLARSQWVRGGSVSRRRPSNSPECLPDLPSEVWGLLTAKQQEALRLRSEGLSESAIARRLGVGRESVRERLLRAGVRVLKANMDGPSGGPGHTVPPRGIAPGAWASLTSRQRAVLELAVRGASLRKMSVHLRISPDAVLERLARARRRLRRPLSSAQHIRRASVWVASSGWRDQVPPRWTKALDLWCSGATAREVGHELGVSKGAASALLHRIRSSLKSRRLPA